VTDSQQEARKQNSALQIVLVAGLLIAAFFGAFKFASARGGQGAASLTGATRSSGQFAGAGQPAAAGGSSSGNAVAAGGCSCCDSGGQATSNGVTGAVVEGRAQVTGGVQAIAVKVGTTYSPNVIRLKSGIPAEITFGQGGGCTAQVMSKDIGFSEDLSAGPKVIKLPAMKPGEYSFSCGMGMVFGKIVVE